MNHLIFTETGNGSGNCYECNAGFEPDFDWVSKRIMPGEVVPCHCPGCGRRCANPIVSGSFLFGFCDGSPVAMPTSLPGVVLDGRCRGWLVTNGSGFGPGQEVIYPPSSDEDAEYSARCLSEADIRVKKVRRRIEDRLRKGGASAVISAAVNAENIV